MSMSASRASSIRERVSRVTLYSLRSIRPMWLWFIIMMILLHKLRDDRHGCGGHGVARVQNVVYKPFCVTLYSSFLKLKGESLDKGSHTERLTAPSASRHRYDKVVAVCVKRIIYLVVLYH